MLNNITKISKEINNLKKNKNDCLDRLINLMKSNGSKKKQFTTKLEIEKIDIALKKKKIEKENMLIELFKSI